MSRSRTTRKYSHSPYFAAKKAAARRINELAGLSVGAFPSVERRVAALGKVFLPRTAGFLADRRRTAGFRHPSRARPSLDAVSELGGFTGAMGIALAMDIGEAIVRDVKTLADPRARAVLKRELLRDLRIVRRPLYYANETKRRRALAAERRKVRRATTTAPRPTPEAILAAWKARKDSAEAMIRLGSLLRDLSCYVDSTLRFDGSGSVVGRNAGIRGWLRENLPELSAKYKTLMRYKAMDRKLRQATGTHDPTPTYAVCERAKAPDEPPDGAGTGRNASRMRGETGMGETNENLMRKILAAAAGRVEGRGSSGRSEGRNCDGCGGRSGSGESNGGGERNGGRSGGCDRGRCGDRGGGRARLVRAGARESFAALVRAIDLSVRVECVGYC